MIRYFLVIFLVFGSSGILFAEEEKEKEPDEKPHSSAEIALDVTKGVVYSAGAGVAAARLNVPGTIAGIIAGAESFKRAGDKAFENIEYEKNRDNDNEDRENDRDSWDRDY